MKFTFKQNEKQFTWEFIQYESDNKTLANITGFSVLLQIKNRSTALLETIAGSVDAPNSKATFTVPDNFFDVIGLYDADLKWTSGAIVRYATTFTIEVIDDL